MDESAPPAKVLVLVGTAGWVLHERFILAPDKPTVIGRSRQCDISLRRIKAYLDLPSEERDNDHDFNTVSRQHVRLEPHDALIHIEDLSTNGTFCDGVLLCEPRDLDPSARAIEVRLGTRETFRLGLVPADQADTWDGVPAGSTP